MTTSPVLRRVQELVAAEVHADVVDVAGVGEEHQVAGLEVRLVGDLDAVGRLDLRVGHARDLDAGLRVGPLHQARSSRSRSAASSRPTCSRCRGTSRPPGSRPAPSPRARGRPRSPPAPAPTISAGSLALPTAAALAAAAAGSTARRPPRRGAAAGCARRRARAGRWPPRAWSGSGRGTARRGARRRRSTRRSWFGSSTDLPATSRWRLTASAWSRNHLTCSSGFSG